MSEPLHIPLSAYQIARFAAFQQELATFQAGLQQRVNDTLTGIVAGHVDPAKLSTWHIAVTADAIVCTPPADAQPELALVADSA